MENRNPSGQIYYYLDSTPPDWGILTNGRRWRLYYDEISLSQWFDTYYEVDLIDILEKDDFESFKYFYLFFRKDAFIPVGDSFLDQVYQGSERFAQEIGESLEDNVYNALRWMAKGYFDMGSNNLEKTKENVKKVHDNSLIFLYRLIFLMYAESNGLLKSGGEIPEKYSQYSVYEWAEELLEDWDNDKLDEKAGLQYYNLSRIFRMVREGSEELGISKEDFYVPAYNGGLFDNQKHPFFDNYKIQDGKLAEVVDLLLRTYSEEVGERVWIDYSDLSLRHLGGIYEGLLEHQLEKAPEDLVAEGDSKTGKWISASEASKDFTEFDEENRRQEGELYLKTDEGKRKATGSYYTPDYIVKYIVENTVGPVIEEKLEDAETDEEKRQAILSTNILDPAMGSGHFLVETIDFIASRLVEFVENGGQERDIDWAKRKVARNCIYGVDINPLATELAKVSLWLNTMAEDKPLSFLDHHLKTGDSLIGADLHDLDKHPEEKGETGEQKTFYDGKTFQENIKELLDLLKSIEDITEEDLEDIENQKKLLKEFETHPFKRKFDILADVQTSYYFGNEFSKKQYWRLRDIIVGEDIKESDVEKLLQKEHVKKVTAKKSEEREDRLSGEKKFFHWKLEFPEAFFDIEEGTEKDNPGFNVVIGNPPYLLMENIPKATRDFAYGSKKVSNYISANRKTNIYALFIEKGYNLLKSGGRLGYINPYSWMGNSSFEPLRNLILEDTAIEEITLLPNDIFDNPDTESSIFSFSKKPPKEAFRGRDLSDKDVSNNPDLLKKSDFRQFYQKDFLEFPENIITFRLDKEDQRIIAKIREDTKKLEDFCKVDLGVKTADDEKFTGTVKKKERNPKRLLRGKDFTRYSYNWDGDYLYYEPEKMKENKSTARPGTKERFESPKLIMHRFSSENFKVALDRKGHYTLSSTYTIRNNQNSNLETIAGQLNSKIHQYYLQKFITSNRLSKTPVRELPISSKSNDNLKKDVAELKRKKEIREENIGDFIEWLDSRYDVASDLKKKISNELPMENFPDFLELLNKNESKIGDEYSDFSEHDKLKKGWNQIIEKIDELNTEIREINSKVNSVVFNLYGLTKAEIKTVLDSLDTEEEVKQDILEKYNSLN